MFEFADLIYWFYQQHYSDMDRKASSFHIEIEKVRKKILMYLLKLNPGNTQGSSRKRKLMFNLTSRSLNTDYRLGSWANP
ncbi:MAG TPA: hypothetical protein QF887_18295, partial [SAR324 cluster bacterium]|nr:hypothetical protein [SAR324 cluster bacterium]